MKKIILASTSPRRKNLLRQLIGDNYEIVSSNYEEDNTLDMEPKDLTMKHAIGKGTDVAKNLTEGIVIAADTLVEYNGCVLGKPHTPEKAKEMLNIISGNYVNVYTGLAIIEINGQTFQDFEKTKVKIKKLSEKEIDDYVASGEPLDKAGAFGTQEKGIFLVESVQGDYSNVVGLPLQKVYAIFQKLGISIFDYN